MSSAPTTHPFAPIPLPEDPPRWPQVIGIISIVLGSLGLLGGLCILSSPLMLKMMSGMVEQKLGPMPPPMIPSLAQMGLGGVGLVWASLLLAAGIATLNRRRSGRTLHLVYVCSLATTAVGLVLMIRQQQALAEWYAAHADSEWSKRQSPVGSMIGMGCGVILGVCWPLFCAAWFAPKSHSPEIGYEEAPLG